MGKAIVNYVLVFVCSLAHILYAQGITSDTTIILISDPTIQIEATHALDDLYNFKFDKAEGQFKWMKKKYAWHPLPYFLMGLNEWWKIMPDINNTSHDKRFIAYMDTTIWVAEQLYKKASPYKVEASFFLAAAYGFQGRLYSTNARSKWLKAASVARRALHYMNKAKAGNHLSPELLFGEALYNYFTVWASENYPSLRPVLWFFHKGDKKLGIEQLKTVSYNAFYTRMEAMVWLMRIYGVYENKPSESCRLAAYLHNLYPENAYLHRYYIRMLYVLGRYDELIIQSKQIIASVENNLVGYEYNVGKYAAFYLGRLYQARQQTDDAERYYTMAKMYATKSNDSHSSYYTESLAFLAEIAIKKDDRKTAFSLLTDIKKASKRGSASYKAAHKQLNQIKMKH